MGAILVRDQTIISTGYNGSMRSRPHCIDDGVGCMMEDGHCVPGDTVISKFQTGHYNTGHRTVKQIYDQWQHPKKRGAMVRMNIRSVTSEGVIVPDRIVDIWKKPPQRLFRLTTKLGRSVRTTAEHLVLTLDGWKEMTSLTPGTQVALNGQPLYEDRKWLSRQYLEEGRTQIAIAEIAGCNRKTIKDRLD